MRPFLSLEKVLLLQFMGHFRGGQECVVLGQLLVGSPDCATLTAW